MADDRAARVLLVEDDDSLRESVAAALGACGFDVQAESDGSAAESVVAAFGPDAVILDILLPGANGFEVASRIRNVSTVPVMFLSALDGVDDRLRGFDTGADDYLVKPFAMAELLARLRAILRRNERFASAVIRAGDVTIDEAARVATRRDNAIDLTPTEFGLLCVFARAPGRVFSKQELLSLVWRYDEYDPNLVEVYISTLRRKLERCGSRLIHTVRGEGYVLQV